MTDKRILSNCRTLSRAEQVLLMFIKESDKNKISNGTISYQMVKDTLDISKRTFYHALASLRTKGLLDQV